jgi:hypothetical protein
MNRRQKEIRTIRCWWKADSKACRLKNMIGVDRRMGAVWQTATKIKRGQINRLRRLQYDRQHYMQTASHVKGQTDIWRLEDGRQPCRL